MYAARVGLGADLPTAIRCTGVPPRVVTGVTDLEDGQPHAPRVGVELEQPLPVEIEALVAVEMNQPVQPNRAVTRGS